MHSVSLFFTSLLEAYHFPGIALALLIAVTLVVDIVYISRYRKVASFRLSRQKRKREINPSVSIVIPLFTENGYFLDNGLRKFIEQDYAKKEIVLVYVGNNDDFFNDACMVCSRYREVKATRINCTPTYPVSVKMAINIGIKASSSDYVVISSPNAYPSSEKWLTLLSRGFEYGDITLGYSVYEKGKGAFNAFVRKYTLFSSLPWIVSTIRRRPFGASPINIGYAKSLYFGTKGFNHLNLNCGEGDLYVQHAGTDSNCGLVLAKKAVVLEEYWPGVKQWITQQRERGVTFRYYPSWAKTEMLAEPVVRTLFFTLSIAGIALMPIEFKLCTLGLMFIHYMLTAMSIAKTAKRLGMKGARIFSPLFYITEPWVRFYLHLTQSKKEENAWR